MRQRSLGSNGPQVSQIGFGAWSIGGGWGPQDDAESIAALHVALDSGVNFIDTAAAYGDGHSEQIIAQVLKQRPKSDRVYVTTKTPPSAGPWPPSPFCHWEDRYGAAYLRDNVEQRLRNLGVEQLDVLLLHTWTRAWNDDPQPLLVLRRLKEEGKVALIGVSTPEQDQNCVVQLMRDGLVDVVQVIYNLFVQEPAAQLFPVAAETGTGIIARVPFDEGALTGKYNASKTFPVDDFRHQYFAGDRMARTYHRVEQVRQDLDQYESTQRYSLADAALKFAMDHPAVDTVLAGMRTVEQVRMNINASDLPDFPDALRLALRRHNWHRGVWYGGK